MTTKTDHAKDQAQAQLDSIAEMVTALEKDEDWEGQPALEAIAESPLSVEVRSDWFTPWERLTDTTDDEDTAILTYARQFYFGQ